MKVCCKIFTLYPLPNIYILIDFSLNQTHFVYLNIINIKESWLKLLYNPCCEGLGPHTHDTNTEHFYKTSLHRELCGSEVSLLLFSLCDLIEYFSTVPCFSQGHFYVYVFRSVTVNAVWGHWGVLSEKKLITILFSTYFLQLICVLILAFDYLVIKKQKWSLSDMEKIM